jgi:hypothetical protein
MTAIAAAAQLRREGFFLERDMDYVTRAAERRYRALMGEDGAYRKRTLKSVAPAHHLGVEPAI